MSNQTDASPIRESDLLTSKGVTSDVHGHGHVLLLDYDTNHRDLRSHAKDLPGVNLVFESSPNSWHVWNLTVRGLKDTACEHLSAKADPNHASIGYRRGRWTLRVGPKDTVNASDPYTDHYKDGPVYRNGWVNRTEKPQSLPHLEIAESVATKNIELPFQRCPKWVTGETRINEYVTLTDEGKRKVNGR